MAEPNQLESIVRDELHVLLGQLEKEVDNPVTRAQLMAMAEDAAMIPVRIARGEDVAALVLALKSEAQNRALTHRQRVAKAIEDAWIRAIGRILAAVLAAI